MAAGVAEPTIDGIRTDERCLDQPQPEGDEHDGKKVSCMPAAGSIAVLGGGTYGPGDGKSNDVLYWDALEDTEEIEASIVGEFGAVSINDQTRRLHLGGPAGPTWSNPTPNDAGAKPDGSATVS